MFGLEFTRSMAPFLLNIKGGNDMKKIFILLIILCFISMGLFAQNVDDLKKAFNDFSTGVAGSLPLASNIGLNWNDAYQKPGVLPVSVGAGLTVGAAFIPSEAFSSIATELGITEVKDAVDKIGLGAPLPVYSADVRVGVKFLPIDAGVKFGTITPEMKGSIASLTGIGFDYTMFGIDARYAVIKQKVMIPDISVGGGYTFMSGNLSMDGPSGTTINIAGTGAGTNLNIGSSDIVFGWQSSIIDVKAQASWKLVLLNLSAGVGYSHGFSSAGGGFDANVLIDGAPINQTQKDQLSSYGVDITSSGLNVLNEVNGGSFRAFGGAGLNLGPIKWDFGVLYGLNTGSLGGSTNIRLQI